MTQKTQQLDALTGARGLAAWYVVFYHVREAFNDAVPIGVISFFSKGYLAVDLFFVLSGFVMWLNYGAKFERDGLRAAPDFLMRRLARIYPLHFVILSAMLAFAVILNATGRADPVHYPLSQLPLHYLLMQNWGITADLAWNDPAWSISTELGAYIALPFVALGLTRVKRGLITNIALVALLCAGLAFTLEARQAAHLGDGISQNGLIRCLFEFFVGVMVCCIFQQTSGARRSLIAKASLGVVVVIAILWANGTASEIAAFPALCAATVFCLAHWSNRAADPFSSKLLIHLGDISYSTYLVHFFLWIIFKILFVSDANNVSLPVMMLFAGCTYLASIILYRLIETPGRHWLQNLFKRRKAMDSAALTG